MHKSASRFSLFNSTFWHIFRNLDRYFLRFESVAYSSTSLSTDLKKGISSALGNVKFPSCKFLRLFQISDLSFRMSSHMSTRYSKIFEEKGRELTVILEIWILPLVPTDAPPWLSCPLLTNQHKGKQSPNDVSKHWKACLFILFYLFIQEHLA